MSRLETIVSPVSQKIFEAWDQMSLSGVPLAQHPWLSQQGNWSALQANFWPTTGGGAFAETLHPVLGTVAWKGVTALNTWNAHVASWFGMPLSRRYSTGAPTQLTPNQGWPVRRYYFGVLAWREALTAGVQLSVGIRRGGNALAEILTTTGFELICDSGINGGNWTPQQRLVSNAAIVPGPDSGVSGLNLVSLLEFLYTESAVPTLTMSVNGTVVQTITGNANMPAIEPANASGLLWEPSVIFGGAAAPANDVAWYAGSHIYVQNEILVI